MESCPTETTAAPSRVRWIVFALAFFTSAILYWHRYVFAFVKPVLAEEWQLTNTQLADIDSAFALTYSLCQFPLAVLADLLGVHLVLSTLCLIWCGGLLLLALAPNAGWLWYGQAILGTGQSAVYACLSRVSKNWYPASVRTTMQGAVGVMAGRLGALSSSLVFTTILLGYVGLPWRWAVVVLVSVGLVHTALFAAIFRNSPRLHSGVNEQEAKLIEDSPSPSAETLGNPPAVRMSSRSMLNLGFVAVQTILSTFADTLYSNWLPQFLKQVHNLDWKLMGFYAALPFLGGALAGILAGYLNDRLILLTGNRRWARAGVAMVGKGMAAVLIFVALNFYNDPYAFCICLFFVKLFGDWSLTSVWGVVTDIGGRATASVFAFSNSVAGIGLVLAPQVFGRLADNYGWQPVFVTVGVTYAACACSWLFIDSNRPVLDCTDTR